MTAWSAWPVAAAVIITVAVAGPLAGQTPATLPADAGLAPANAAAQRSAEILAQWHVIKRFDFDEAPINEGREPMHWYRFRGAAFPDFPRFAEGVWDRRFGYKSSESFRLECNGGNIGYYYRPDTISILPGQDVRVEAMIRTTQLVHARAVLEVSFNDARGQLIAGSRRRSELIGGLGSNDRWMPIAVLVPGKFPTARYVNLNVFVLQPARWRLLEQPNASQPDVIDYVDVHGKAWFDDITVYRLPRVSLTTGHPAQLIRDGQSPEVSISIEGFANQPLEAEFAVRDASGRQVGRELFKSSTSGSSVRTLVWTSKPLPAGLYRAHLALYAGGARQAGLPPLLVRNLVFAQLGPVTRRHHHGQNFGITLEAPPIGLEPAAARRLAAELAIACAQMRVSLVKLPLWRHDQSLAQIEQADVWAEELVERLSRARIGLVGVFGQPPGPLLASHQADPGSKLLLRRSLLDVLSGEPAIWQPYLIAQLARHAEQVRYWQIGQDDEPAFANDDRFHATIRTAGRELGRLLTDPKMVAAWPAGRQYEQTSPTARPFPAPIASLFLSNQTPAQAIFAQLTAQASITDRRPWATVEPMDHRQHSREYRLADTAWRLTMAAAAVAEQVAPAVLAGPKSPGNVFINAPWTVRDETGSELIEPIEELLVFRNIADLLGGCSYGGAVVLADGVVGHIFDRGDSTGVIAVRNDTGQRLVPIRMLVGENAESIDLWGNRQPVPGTKPLDGQTVEQEFTAGQLPFFLNNIDPRLARLRASFKLDPAFLPSSYRRHSRRVTFVNPFQTPINGRITLRFPPNWEVHPRIISFTAQPGETFSREVEIRFPYNAEAGTKQLLADFAFDADRSYRVQIGARFEFGLGDVQVETMSQWLPGDELMVTLNVTNCSDSRLDLFCFVVAPDQPRQERVIAALQPGATAIRSFRVPAARALIGQSLRVGLREVRGSRIVNYDVPVR